MNKNLNTSNQLRFEEFSYPLLQKQLSDVIHSNIYGPRFNANDYDQHGNVKTIRGTDISLDGDIKYSQVPIARIDKNTVETHKLKDGDLVMITTADCGLTGVFLKQNIEFIASAYAVRLRLNELGYPIYFKYFFQTETAKREIKSYIRKATVANLPGSDILKIRFHLPNFKEQQKIADFLSSIDNKISLLTEKQSLLKSYKKGVMQKLFSQELRFKDDQGNDFPDWEEKKLGDLGTFLGGGTPSTDEKEYWSGDVPWVSSSDTTENSIHKISYTRLITDKAIKDSATKLIPANSLLLVSRVGVGKMAVTLCEVCTSQDFTNFTPVENDVFFIAYYLSFHKNKLISFSQGTSIKGFTIKDIKLLKLKMASLLEQEKIANFLSKIDKKLDAVTQQIEHTKTFKKGLLQKMFV